MDVKYNVILYTFNDDVYFDEVFLIFLLITIFSKFGCIVKTDSWSICGTVWLYEQRGGKVTHV